MSRSSVVDERYRLQPADLSGLPQRALIRQVSFQGLEELTPVLHFDAPFVKHLALSSSQRRELIDALHSSLCGDWIGQVVELQQVRQDEQPTILIGLPTVARPLRSQVARWRFLLLPGWSSILALLLLGLALFIIYWLEHAETLSILTQALSKSHP